MKAGTNNMKIAIITGASSGLGSEYFRALCKSDPDIDEIWLIARRTDRLNALAAEFQSVNALPISFDLSHPESIDKLTEMFKEKNADIKLLINNAGFGYLGELYGQDPQKQVSSIQVNCCALTALTTAALPFMHEGSCIINTCSIAAFAPNPRMTVYSSTKSYVYFFSRSLRFELKSRGINVLAVCPGPMNTEFLPNAGISKGSSHTFDTLPRCDASDVAAKSLAKAKKGHAVYTPRAFYKLYRVLAKLLPASLVMHMSKT
ncbi:MAG TPA: SDR family NAD(P)-dependent oxidoreductase [Bacillota bacterium]|nr:SDR family NAD(P)-dependent oxidoreductase [Bacillota bacterium]